MNDFLFKFLTKILKYNINNFFIKLEKKLFYN